VVTTKRTVELLCCTNLDIIFNEMGDTYCACYRKTGYITTLYIFQYRCAVEFGCPKPFGTGVLSTIYEPLGSSDSVEPGTGLYLTCNPGMCTLHQGGIPFLFLINSFFGTIVSLKCQTATKELFFYRL